MIACGGLDRLTHGILWPRTETGNMARVFCSDINPSFGFGPYATRYCREDATWSQVDTSQCSVRAMQQSTIVLYSTYIEVDSINITNIMSPKINEVSLYTYIVQLLFNLFIYTCIA